MLLALILIIISMYIFLWLWSLTKPFEREIKQRESKKSMYHIPAIFWHDYNKLSLSIYNMTLDDCDKVKYKIDEFEQKYSQYIDLQVYNDRMYLLLNDYQRKHYSLLNYTK